MNTRKSTQDRAPTTNQRSRQRSTSRFTRRSFLQNSARLAVALTGVGIAGSPRLAFGADPRRANLPVADYDATVAHEWFDLTRELVMTNGYSPPIAARSFACAGITLYEALVPGMPGYQSLAGQANDLTSPGTPPGRAYHWPSAANAALVSMTRKLFRDASAADVAKIDSLETSLNAGFLEKAPPGIVRRSAEWGRSVSDHIEDWSKDDGGHDGHLREFPVGYVPPEGDGLWVPTPPGFLRALQPDWGANRPCVLSSEDVCDPGPPPAFSTDPNSDFYQEALQVYETVNGLTEEQETIAKFWADDPGETSTPPGHSVSILTQILRKEGSSLDLAAESYAKLGLAVNDAFISCWNTKYTYNLLRPITYIRRHIDGEWGDPLPVVTPPFPEYTSGHSVQTAASATVLADLFGEPYSFEDATHVDRGFAPRSFSSFEEYAWEAAISRLYGGIHYWSAIDLGVQEGQCVGEAINRLGLKS